jgi:hypothetical protein
MRTGVVLSHASTVVGPLVTPTPDPVAFKAAVEAAQPGCVVTIVSDDGTGWRSEDGATPQQILDRFQRADLWDHDGFDHCQGCFAAYQSSEGVPGV